MHIMRRQLSFCSVLLPHHPQHHLRSFHQIGSAVHAAFLYVSVRLFFCHMIPFHQNRFRFSYLLLLPATPFCGNGSALPAASFHILHHHIHGINQFMDFQRHRHRQAATAPIFLQDMPGGQQKQFKPVRKILRKFRKHHIRQAAAAQNDTVTQPVRMADCRCPRSTDSHNLVPAAYQNTFHFSCIFSFGKSNNNACQRTSPLFPPGLPTSVALIPIQILFQFPCAHLRFIGIPLLFLQFHVFAKSMLSQNAFHQTVPFHLTKCF